jgi:hypothetical protein
VTNIVNKGDMMAETHMSILLNFLTFLRNHRISFELSQERDTCVMVTIALPCIRIEVEIFEDHIEYSYFTGNEDVYSDEAELYKLLKDKSK